METKRTKKEIQTTIRSMLYQSWGSLSKMAYDNEEQLGASLENSLENLFEANDIEFAEKNEKYALKIIKEIMKEYNNK